MASPEWKRQRRAYEFSEETKKAVRKKQKNRCIVTGEKGYTEIHHLLGAALAHGFFPSISPEIFKQEENAIAISPEAHKQLHLEMEKWPKEFLRVFCVGMYCYLRDIYNEKKASV